MSKHITFVRNLIASGEFAVVGANRIHADREIVRYGGKTLYFQRAQAQLPIGNNTPLSRGALQLPVLCGADYYVFHIRRGMAGEKIHASVLSESAPASRRVSYEDIIRVEYPGAKTLHGVRFYVYSKDAPPTTKILEVQRSPNYANHGVEFTILPDGWPAFYIDGWLADYSGCPTLEPAETLEYTRQMVESAGGVYKRNRHGRYVP